MEHAITIQAQDIIDKVNRQNVEMENPLLNSMDDRLIDFRGINPPIFTGLNTSEDPQEFVDGMHKILVDMGATYTKRVEWLRINSQMLQKLGARCGMIFEFRVEFRSPRSFLRHPSWRDSFPGR